MKLKFESIKDLLSFIKMALYMTEKTAAQKMSKWKKNGEMIILPEDKGYVLELSTAKPEDKEFNQVLQNKYKTWLDSDKRQTIKQ